MHCKRVTVPLLLLLGCGSPSRKNIFGDWKGETLRVTNEQGNETVSVPVAKYGYLNLSLDRDSSFAFNLAVLKDVKVERSVMGIDGNVVLLPAVYKSSRFGTFTKSDSDFVLHSRDGSIFVRPDRDLAALTLRFTDGSHRNWSCTLVPKE